MIQAHKKENAVSLKGCRLQYVLQKLNYYISQFSETIKFSSIHIPNEDDDNKFGRNFTIKPFYISAASLGFTNGVPVIS